MTTIEITAGSREGAYWEPDGVFPATLVAVETKGPFPDKNSKVPGATFEMREWCFAIEDAPEDANLVWASSSMGTGPRSKGYGYIVALCAGKAPPVGTKFEVERHLIGRMALVTVRRDQEGYVQVDQVTAMPASMMSQRVGAATGAPVKEAPTNGGIRDQVVAQDDPSGLPF